MPTPGFRAELMPWGTKMKCIKNVNNFKTFTMKVNDHDMWIIHYEVHKSEVDPLPWFIPRINLTVRTKLDPSSQALMKCF